MFNYNCPYSELYMMNFPVTYLVRGVVLKSLLISPFVMYYFA